jgi:hypothetical protein
MLELRQLPGQEEDSFLIRTLITHQGMAETNTLINTGANAFACIDSDLANKLASRFGIPVEHIAGNYSASRIGLTFKHLMIVFWPHCRGLCEYIVDIWGSKLTYFPGPP